MRQFAVVEERFTYHDRECLVVFTRGGYRCGYVSTAEPLDYTTLPIVCHGGLTFAGSLPDELEPSRQYYIGFDCAHFGDGKDIDQAAAYGLLDPSMVDYFKSKVLYDGPVRTKAYVAAQCRHIANQLDNTEDEL